MSSEKDQVKLRKKSEALGKERLGWKNGQSKRRMGNQIARLIDEGLSNLLSGEGVSLVSTEDEELTGSKSCDHFKERNYFKFTILSY